MPTIADISKRTGLAYSTVAEILREKPGYKQATRRRVLRAAEKIGYRPSPIGKALAGGRSMTIGVASQLSTSIAYQRRLIAIHRAAIEHGYSILSAAQPPADSAADLEPLIQQMTDRRVDGMIMLLPSLLAREARFGAITTALATPSVHIGNVPFNHPNVASVVIGLRPAMDAVAAHLRSLGHVEAMYIPTMSDHANPDAKLLPWRDAMANVAMTCRVDPQCTIDPAIPAPRSAYRIVSQLIQAGRLPTALLMSNDQTAIAAIAAVTDAGLGVPRDVSIVGMDDDPDAEHVRPALTTIDQPSEAIGAAAFELLHQRMTDREVAVQRRVFDCNAVLRDSTGPARSHKTGANKP